MQSTVLSPFDLSSGIPAMDALHDDFLNVLTTLSSGADTEFAKNYAALVKKAEHAFRTEESWMEEIDFPSLKTHREQHARVLSALHHIYPRVLEGDVMLGRKVVESLLPQWLAFHASTMDATLAIAMQMAESQNQLPVSRAALEAASAFP